MTMLFTTNHEWTTLQQEAYRIASEHGFHETDTSFKPEDEYVAQAQADQIQRRLMLIVAEIAEASDAHHNKIPVDEVRVVAAGEGRKEIGVPVELADAVIRIADFCETYDIDLWPVIARKMAFNETRPRLHGKAF